METIKDTKYEKYAKVILNEFDLIKVCCFELEYL